MTESEDEPGGWVSDDEIIDVLLNADQPFLLTKDVAEAVNRTSTAAYLRLIKLAEDGEIESMKIKGGGETYLWWDDRVDATRVWAQRDRSRPHGTIGVPLVDGLEISGQGNVLECRRRAVNAVFRLLFLQGEASSSEVRHSARVAATETYGSPRSLISNCIGPARRQAPGLFTYDRDSNTWGLTPFAESLRYQFDWEVYWKDWDERQAIIQDKVEKLTLQATQNIAGVQGLHADLDLNNVRLNIEYDDEQYGLVVTVKDPLFRELSVTLHLSKDTMDTPDDGREIELTLDPYEFTPFGDDIEVNSRLLFDRPSAVGQFLES